LTTNSYFLVAASSAAVGDNNLSSTCSRKQAFVPADPALGGPGAEMGSKKQKRNNLAEYQCRFTRAINLVFVKFCCRCRVTLATNLVFVNCLLWCRESSLPCMHNWVFVSY
jgi:hypothetical protein